MLFWTAERENDLVGKPVNRGCEVLFETILAEVEHHDDRSRSSDMLRYLRLLIARRNVLV